MLELLLAGLVVVQCFRLYDTVVTPVAGPPVPVRSMTVATPPVDLAAFDPFFGTDGAEPPPPLAFGLVVHGIRQGFGFDRGAAIISTPGGEQRSFAVGDEIVPGVRLSAVGPAEIVISRHRALETVPLAQFAGSATPAGPGRPEPAMAGRAIPARSINFADPRTLPRALTDPRQKPRSAVDPWVGGSAGRSGAPRGSGGGGRPARF